MNPGRVLVINVSRIGDTLLVTPALRALAAAWPDAEIDVLGHPGRVEVLANLPFLHRIGRITKKSARFLGWLPWQRASYDLAIVYGFDKELVAYGLRVAKQVVAYRQQDDRLDQRLWKAVGQAPFQSAHSVHLAQQLPSAIGVPPSGHRLAYKLTGNEAEWARKRIAQDIASQARPLIGLQVASFPTKAYRDWPIESFIELCRRLQSDWPNAHFLAFGGTDEHERISTLASALGNAATVYAGRLSLRQTGALMSRIDLYIGVDTGPTHLMSCFDIPMVVLYHGFSRSALIAPLDHPCLYAIDHPLAGPECSTEATMADIPVDRVWDTVVQALRDHPPP